MEERFSSLGQVGRIRLAQVDQRCSHTLTDLDQALKGTHQPFP